MRGDVGEEQGEVAVGGIELGGSIFSTGGRFNRRGRGEQVLEGGGVVVGWGVGVDELGAGVEEELFEGRTSVLANGSS